MLWLQIYFAAVTDQFLGTEFQLEVYWIWHFINVWRMIVRQEILVKKKKKTLFVSSALEVLHHCEL